jgi:hypothetical protein
MNGRASGRLAARLAVRQIVWRAGQPLTRRGAFFHEKRPASAEGVLHFAFTDLARRVVTCVPTLSRLRTLRPRAQRDSLAHSIVAYHIRAGPTATNHHHVSFRFQHEAQVKLLDSSKSKSMPDFKVCLAEGAPTHTYTDTVKTTTAHRRPSLRNPGAEVGSQLPKRTVVEGMWVPYVRGGREADRYVHSCRAGSGLPDARGDTLLTRMNANRSDGSTRLGMEPTVTTTTTTDMLVSWLRGEEHAGGPERAPLTGGLQPSCIPPALQRSVSRFIIYHASPRQSCCASRATPVVVRLKCVLVLHRG